MVAKDVIIKKAKEFAHWRWGSLGESSRHFLEHRKLLVGGSAILTALSNLADLKAKEKNQKKAKEKEKNPDAEPEAEANLTQEQKIAREFRQHGILRGYAHVSNIVHTKNTPADPAAAPAIINIQDDDPESDSGYQIVSLCVEHCVHRKLNCHAIHSY